MGATEAGMLKWLSELERRITLLEGHLEQHIASIEKRLERLERNDATGPPGLSSPLKKIRRDK